MLWELGRNRGTLQILFMLHGETSVTISRLRRRVKSGEVAIESALRSLARMGLIGCDSLRTFPFSKRYRLAELGTALVETPLYSWPRVLATRA
jgi:DNA-binding HxlR family transcriptional regulator